MSRYIHKYTEEQKAFIRDNIKGNSYQRVTDMFNQHFGLELNLYRIKALIARLGVQNGRNTKFNAEQIPHNKGVYSRWSPATEFKKGNIPVNHRPVGSERISKDGYIEVKIAEPKKWALKHRIVWEQVNGPVQKGQVILFKDGDKLNISLDNLMLISRSELLILNQCGLIYSDPDLTKSGVMVAKIIAKNNKRRRGE